jgi:SAM-dependent methyltransferase
VSGESPAHELLRLLDGYRAVQALYAAAELGLADHLAPGARDADQLARAVGANPESLRRLLRALASLGVVVENAGGDFALAAAGEPLRSNVPGSLRAAVIYYGGRRHWTAWGQLLHSVRSGSPAFGGTSPTSFAEMASRAPEAAQAFNEAMAALSGPVSTAVVAAYDFSAARLVVDVGGGHGTLLAAVLAANPHLRGILFDLPAVVAGAHGRLRIAAVAERCDVVAGDAFAAVPGGGDVYLLEWILHDWSDEQSIALLRNCRRAIAEDGRLLLVERVLPERAEASAAAAPAFFSDLNMLLLSSGRERTAVEYRELLRRAGFALRRIIPIAAPHSIVEAAPAPEPGV